MKGSKKSPTWNRQTIKAIGVVLSLVVMVVGATAPAAAQNTCDTGSGIGSSDSPPYVQPTKALEDGHGSGSSPDEARGGTLGAIAGAPLGLTGMAGGYVLGEEIDDCDEIDTSPF